MRTDIALRECPFRLNADGFWECPQCERPYSIKLDKPPKRDCPRAPSIVEAAKKLGIPENEIGRYASMLQQWQAEDCPIRDPGEIDWIHENLCLPCESHVGDCRLGKCGKGACKKRSHSIELKYMLRMETACCPLYKF